jgi:WD40 repeat protein
MDHHRTEPAFATGSNLVQLWDETKSVPVSNLTFGGSTETVDSLRFNLSESSVLATAGSDRTLTIYDVRTGKAERRIIMQVRVFLVCHYNEIYAMVFTVPHKFTSMVAYVPNVHPPSVGGSQPLHI